MVKKYYEEIDCIRAIGILLVVLGHSFFGNFNTGIQSVIFETIYSFHMQLFFIIAGFCYYNIAGKGIAIFLKKKTLHLAVPYFVLSAFLLVLKAVIPQFAKNQYSITDSWKILIGISPMGSSWFLWTLFMVMFIFSVCYIKGEHKKLNLYLLLPLFIVIYFSRFLKFMNFENNEGLIKVVFYCVFFLVGLLIREYYDYITKFCDKITPKKKLLISIICFAFIIITTVFVHQTGIVNDIIQTIKACVGFIGVYNISLLLAQTKALKYCKILSNYSMDIYIISYFTTLVIEVVYSKLKYSLPMFWLMVLVCSVIGVIVPYLLSKYIIRKIPILRTLFLGYLPKKQNMEKINV